MAVGSRENFLGDGRSFRDSLGGGASLALASVILALGAGPSGFPKQLSGRRPKLPRQPWQTRAVARARSVILALGAGPSGFPGDGQSSATASLALASVILALGAGRTGFPKQVSERCKARGSWTPTAMANPRRRTRALRYFGARVWPVGLPETIFRAKLPRQPWQTRAVARAHSVILALGGWPDGLPETSFRAMHSGGILEAAAAYAARSLCPDYQASGRNGRFINQKRRNCQISSFGLRMADFVLSRIRSLSAARPSHF